MNIILESKSDFGTSEKKVIGPFDQVEVFKGGKSIRANNGEQSWDITQNSLFGDVYYADRLWDNLTVTNGDEDAEEYIEAFLPRHLANKDPLEILDFGNTIISLPSNDEIRYGSVLTSDSSFIAVGNPDRQFGIVTIKNEDIDAICDILRTKLN